MIIRRVAGTFARHEHPTVAGVVYDLADCIESATFSGEHWRVDRFISRLFYEMDWYIRYRIHSHVINKADRK